MTNLTPLRREMLARLAEADRPLSIDEVRAGHPNSMPTLINADWVTGAVKDGNFVGYVITEAGRAALGQ